MASDKRKEFSLSRRRVEEGWAWRSNSGQQTAGRVRQRDAAPLRFRLLVRADYRAAGEVLPFIPMVALHGLNAADPAVRNYDVGHAISSQLHADLWVAA